MSQRTYPLSTVLPPTVCPRRRRRRHYIHHTLSTEGAEHAFGRVEQDLPDGIISSEMELAAVPVVQVGVGAGAHAFVGPAAARAAMAGPSARSLQDGLRAAEAGIAAAEAVIAAAEGVRARRARRDR